MGDDMKQWCKSHREVYLLLLIPVSLVLTALARISPVFAEEVFAKRIYKVCSVVLNRITGILPFSLAEILAVSLMIAGVILLIRLVVQLVRGRSRGVEKRRREILGDALLHLGCFLSVVLFLFVFFCGVNYERYPFSHYSGLVIEKSEKQELYELCVSLAVQASQERERLTEVPTYREMAEAAVTAMDLLGEEYQVLAGAYTVPKPLLSSGFFSMTETTGIFIPFTMEANVNVHCTDFTIPATMCHELSHLRGFMREDEANYIAYLACRKSEDPYLRYSGLMLALVYAGNQLYRADKELYAQARAYYSEGVSEDFRRDSLYWSQYEDTVISTAANAANDTYLKANNQTDGAKSYGRMVDLLLAEYRKEKEEKEHGTD